MTWDEMRDELKAEAEADLLRAAKLAVIELGYVKHAEAESNALPDLREAIAKAERGGR